MGWALAHLSERDAVFSSNDLFAAALAFNPGAASIGEIEQAVAGLKREGRLHDAPALEGGGGLTTDTAVAQERETVSLMRTGSGRGKAPMRGWMVDRHLRKGPLTAGQQQAVKLILSEKDRTVGVQGYAGTGKTRMLNRARTLAEKKGWRMVGLAPSASAAQTLAANYAPGDIVAFHRPYKRLGVEKGDERRVMGVDHRARTVDLEAPDGSVVGWKPSHIGGRRGGTEVYRSETMELRAGDRIRWTRNDAGLGIVNSGVAEVTAVRKGRVSFLLEDGRRLDLREGDAQLRHLDHAWASTVHAFQGRTVDNVIAAMEANHPHLTTAKSFYVEISRARDRAELVTDDAAALKERLEAVTGERISALEGIGETVGREHAKEGKILLAGERPDRELTSPSAPERDFGRELASDKEPSIPARHVELEMGL